MSVFDVLTAAAFIVAVSPHFWRLGRHYYRKWIIKAFWDGESEQYVVAFPYHKDPSSDTYRYVKHEDVSAARRLEAFLTNYGYKVILKRSVDVLSDQEKASNVVVVGSSRTNDIVAKYFPDLESVYCFGSSDSEYFILDKEGHVRIVSPMDKGVSADFALIVKMPNPYKPLNRVYYIAGIHAVGTWAAAEHVTSSRRLRQMPGISGDRTLVAILEAKFSGFYHISEFDDFMRPRLISRSKPVSVTHEGKGELA